MTQDFSKPALLIDEQKCRQNIQVMADKAKRHDLIFRPHFKTHQSLKVGRWFKEYGVSQITVSSVTMAEYFAPEWKDITIAFPVNVLEIDAINKLAKEINLNILVESVEAAKFLVDNLLHDLTIFLKVDVGSHRTGIDPDNKELISNILAIISASDKMNFEGFLAHAGHTYKCKKREDIIAIHEECLAVMNELKSQYKDQFPNLITSLGDTPSCSVANNFDDLVEIRPGNFVYYDLMQHQIGSCVIDQIAVAVSCPIVAIHKERSEIVIYGGGVHFSKDRLKDDGIIIYGRVVEKIDQKWGDIIEDAYIKSLSQEHGVVHVPTALIDNYKIGDTLLILPVHSCMTADLLG